MKLLQCPECRTYTPAIRRDGPLLILACRVCGRDVVWRAVFARRQELRCDQPAAARRRLRAG